MPNEATAMPSPEMIEMSEEEARCIAELLDKLIAAAEESVERLDRIHEVMLGVRAAMRGVSVEELKKEESRNAVS
jgi:hypothetical protein